MTSHVIPYSPDLLSEDEIKACLSVIKEGDAVSLESAKKELPEAMVIAIKREGQDIVGVGAIKKQRPKYASGISDKSGFSFDNNIHELGYVAVRPSHQGQRLSHELMETLLSAFKVRPIFATTSYDRMKRTLTQAGFVQQGKEWAGTKGNLVSLWIKASE